MKSVANPTKRTIPPPTPFELVKNHLPEDSYHLALKKSKRGYYVDALKQLASAKRGTVLKFKSEKGMPGCKTAAKKLGYTLMFATEGEFLFVQIVDTGEDK